MLFSFGTSATPLIKIGEVEVVASLWLVNLVWEVFAGV